MAYNQLNQSIENLVKSESEELKTLAVSNASHLDRLITGKRIIIKQIARQPNTVAFLSIEQQLPIKEQLYSKVKSSLELVLKSSSNYESAFVIDKNGTCRVSTNRICIGKNYSYRSYFKKAIKARGVAPTSIAVDVVSGRLSFYFSHPIHSEKGEIMGVAVLRVKGSQIKNAIDSINIDSHVEAFLIDERGIIMAHPNDSLLYRSLNELPAETQEKLRVEKTYGSQRIKSLKLPRLAQATIGADREGNVSYYSPAEEIFQIAGFSPLKKEPWVLGVNKPRIIFEAPIRKMLWQNGRLILLGVGVASLFSILLSRQLLKPIRDLTEAGKALQKGEFKPESLTEASRSQDDLGMLARVFVQMAQEINQREQSLKSQVENLRIEIDETRKDYQIEEITKTKYFKDLETQAQELN